MSGRGAPSSKFVRFGVPMVLFCVVGYVGLTKFITGKYEAVDNRVKRRSERSVQLEAAHKAIVGKLALDDYEIRPVPRPQSK